MRGRKLLDLKSHRADDAVRVLRLHDVPDAQSTLDQGCILNVPRRSERGQLVIKETNQENGWQGATLALQKTNFAITARNKRSCRSMINVLPNAGGCHTSTNSVLCVTKSLPEQCKSEALLFSRTPVFHDDFQQQHCTDADADACSSMHRMLDLIVANGGYDETRMEVPRQRRWATIQHVIAASACLYMCPR